MHSPQATAMNTNFYLVHNAIFAIVLVAMLSLSFSACSDDDDDDSKNSLMMLAIPAGTFVMGDATASKEVNERPARTVTIRAFMMSRTEVTQKQYLDIMGANPSKAQGENRPVENLTWYEAIEFCNKLSEKEGRTPCYTGIPNSVACDFSANGYRLPTEAEWEYACRAGTTTMYYNGNSTSELDRCSWSSSNSGGSTKDVMQLQANDWGLFDMHGNVNEWCWDWYKVDYYGENVNDNPLGPDVGTEKVCRGGAWFAFHYSHRSSFRSMLRPAFRGIDIGFRVVHKQG